MLQWSWRQKCNKQRNATTQDKNCHMSERTPSLNDLVGVALPCDFLSLWKPQRHQKNVMCTDFCGKENLNLMTTHTFYIIAFERISFLDNFQNLATHCLRTSDVRKQPTSSWTEESPPISSPQCQGWQRLPRQGLPGLQEVIWLHWRFQRGGRPRWSEPGCRPRSNKPSGRPRSSEWQRKYRDDFGYAASPSSWEDCIIPWLQVPGELTLYWDKNAWESDD